MSWGVVHLGLLLAISLFASTAHCNHVVVLQPESESAEEWHPSTPAVIAELALAGFTVSVERLSPDAVLLESLARVANQPGVLASVSVERRGDVSIGYLWFKQATSPILVEERANQTVVAHSVVVLKLTELLLEHQMAPPPNDERVAPREGRKPKELTRARPVQSSHAEPQYLFRAWLGAGWETLGLARAHTWRLGLAAELQVAKGFGLTAGVNLPLSPYELESRLGTAEVRATDVGVGLVFDVFDASHFVVAVGPRASVSFLEAYAGASSEYDAQRAFARLFVLGADVRGVYRLDSAFNVGLSVRGSWSTPEPRLTSDSGDGVALGSLSWSGQLLLGWEFGL